MRDDFFILRVEVFFMTFFFFFGYFSSSLFHSRTPEASSCRSVLFLREGVFFMVLFVSNLLVFFLPSARVVFWGFFFRARLWVAFSTRGLGGAFRERLGSAPPNLAGAHLT